MLDRWKVTLFVTHPDCVSGNLSANGLGLKSPLRRDLIMVGRFAQTLRM